MYTNLRSALRKKNISQREYAEFLGLTEKSVQNKLNGTTDFTYPEFRKTCKFLLPEFSPDFLFASEKDAEEKNKRRNDVSDHPATNNAPSRR